MAKKIAKAYEMTDAKITFVSLVNKAANKKQFFITKQKDGQASFQTYGRILKTDSEAHYVTGIVYEPMTEDTQGNYMTEDEITKAAHWFAKNGNNVDLQHSFEPLDGATVVESSVAKCDYELEGETIKKGTWVMTVEITDPEIFESIEKGEITGFSMGGMGKYSEEDVDITKSGCGGGTKSKKDDDEKTKKGKGIMKQLASVFGLDVVEKGEVKENYTSRITSENFWQAFYALQDALFKWNWYEERRMYETDPEKVQEALTDFNEIVADLLTTPNVAKSVGGICKAGKKLSNANKETLKGIHESLGEFLAKFDEEEEEIEVTKSEVQEIVKAALAECMGAPADQTPQGTGDPENITKEDIQKIVKQAVAGMANPKPAQPQEDGNITKADVQAMIDAAIKKATGEEEDPPQEPSSVDMGEAITKAVTAAMEPFMKQAGLPTNLNNSNLQKSEEEVHYMHGFI